MGMEFPDNRRKADDSYRAFSWRWWEFFSGPLRRSTACEATMKSLQGYLLVTLGAGIGGALRHAVGRIAPLSIASFPWSTMIVNVSGSLVMGLIAGWFAFRGVRGGQYLALFL